MLGRIMEGWSDCQLTNVAIAPQEAWTWGKYLDRQSGTQQERGCLVAQAVDFRSIPQPRWRFWQPSRGMTLHKRLSSLPDASTAVRRFDALVRWIALRELKRLRRDPSRARGWTRNREQEVEEAAMARLVPLIQGRAWKILARRSADALAGPQPSLPVPETAEPVAV